jgi:hypothetical protein
VPLVLNDYFDTPEGVYGRMVASALKADSVCLHDDGSAPAMFDVEITVNDQRIALEITSIAASRWRETADAVGKHSDKLAGTGLSHRWWVVFDNRASVRALAPLIEPALRSLERAGFESLAHARLARIGDATADAGCSRFETGPLGAVHSAEVWTESGSTEAPKILLAQAEAVISNSQTFNTAIASLFAHARDNQAKLAAAMAEERHLFVSIEDHTVGAAIAAAWPLPPCPPDPAGIVDVVWIYALSSSGWLFRGSPGSPDWFRYVAATGDAAVEATG